MTRLTVLGSVIASALGFDGGLAGVGTAGADGRGDPDVLGGDGGPDEPGAGATGTP